MIVIHDEPDAESLVQFLVAFYEAMQTMGPESLDSGILLPLAVDPNDSERIPVIQEKIPILAYIARAISGQISEIFHRIQTRDRRRNDQDLYDQEMEEALREEEDMEDAVLGELSRAVHITFKTHPQTFLPHFHQGLLPTVSGMLHADVAQSMGDQAKQWSICVFDDLIEFCGAERAWEYRSHFWDALMQGCMNRESPDVRQASCYGIGTLAFQVSLCTSPNTDVNTTTVPAALDAWSGPLLEVFGILMASLSQPWSRDEDQVLATENTVSAIGKVIHYILTPLVQLSRLQQDEMHQALSQWLQFLPIIQDEEEALHTYGYLIELLHQQHPVLAQNAGQVAKILVHVVAEGVLTRVGVDAKNGWPGYGSGKELAEQVANAMKVVVRSCPEQVKLGIWGGLDAEKRNQLSALNLI